MSRRRPIGAVNAAPTVVVDYAPDPNGTATVAGLGAVLQRGIDGRDGLLVLGDKGRPETSFNGDLGRSPQVFTGAAALALYGTATPTKPTSGTFDNGQTTFGDDLNLRIFAARARRRRA